MRAERGAALRRLVVMTLVIAGCAATAVPTATPGLTPAASWRADPVAEENSRRLLAQHVRAFSRQLEDGVPRTLSLINSPLDVSPDDDAEALVRLGENLADWIASERAWLVEQTVGPCSGEALTLYGSGLDALDTVVERLFDAPADAGAAGVRAEEANDDAAAALAAVQSALPDDCTP